MHEIYFEWSSVTVSTIYCFNPKLRLFFVRNWVLLYINENGKRWTYLSRSSYKCGFTFLCLSFGHLAPNKQNTHFKSIACYRLLTIPINCSRFCLSIIIDKLFFSVTSISIGFRYQSILIGGLNRLIAMISIDFRYQLLSINYVWGCMWQQKVQHR